MLRGPQTTAGLRGNCERMAAGPDLAGCEELLAHLSGGAEPLVRKQDPDSALQQAGAGQECGGRLRPVRPAGPADPRGS